MHFLNYVSWIESLNSMFQDFTIVITVRIDVFVLQILCFDITLLSCRNSRSQSCPFCRDNLMKTCPGDLWIYVEDQDVVDMETVSSENLRRLFMYISKLPLIVPDVIFSVYDSHIK